MGKALDRVSESAILQLAITLVTYAFYACIIGLSLGPSIAFLAWAWKTIIATGSAHGFAAAVGAALGGGAGAKGPGFWSWVLFSLCAGGSIYLYFITGILVMGLAIRALSLGIKPGIYPDASPTMLRWLIYSGIYTIARATILPMVPMTWFSNLFYKLLGCKMGKHVFLNTWTLNDAYLIELGDDVTVGGGAELSCHLYEKGRLVLDRIRIGEGSLVGANCYISPGVTIGKKCVVGLGSVLRRGKTIPDGVHYTSLAGLPVREMARIEKSARHRSPARERADGE
jgi:acetyltransferase-like isoleucine patch superfamily enzyme